MGAIGDRLAGALGLVGQRMCQRAGAGGCGGGQLGGLGSDLLERGRGGRRDLVDHLLELSQHALDVDGGSAAFALPVLSWDSGPGSLVVPSSCGCAESVMTHLVCALGPILFP